MGHSHNHSHDHGHHHHGSKNKKALKLSFIIIATFMIVEVIGGILTNSLALISDAGHMLSDAAALGLSFLALTFGEKEASLSKTFGYKRFEILAAFINGITLIAISIYIFWEAYKRILSPPEVISGGMLIVSFIGLVVNIAAAFILMRGDKDDNLNVRSAFLHVLGDLLGSIGAIVAALLIMFFGWSLADPIASVLVAILIIVSGFRVTRDSFHILMEGAPHNIKVEEVKNALLTVSGVNNVHDLHIWSITSDFPALSCHVVVEPGTGYQDIVTEVTRVLQDNFHLEHTTIQIDIDGQACDGNHCN
ncbi:cation diffusion facilitator family transporter [Metabacillus arenae]|uniref:Cation transporter n=1 Tax=Metabacillus arenae TaxID=2771434 RepID=A0A926RZ81_9BACI|nr:cation diffusion facilitator family transporter [Metabacillus arenae]MBD1382831.1 cation transporter [Metabacillus arenae]